MTHIRLDWATETKGIDLARDMLLTGSTFGETRVRVAQALGIPTRTAHRIAEIGESVARYILRQRAVELVGAERVANLDGRTT